MFRIDTIGKRGWTKTTVQITAVAPIQHTRKKLSWDHTGSPAVELDSLSIAEGETFELKLPHAAATPGKMLAMTEIENEGVFARLWGPRTIV
jgi:hypothetical protein